MQISVKKQTCCSQRSSMFRVMVCLQPHTNKQENPRRSFNRFRILGGSRKLVWPLALQPLMCSGR